MIRQDEYEEIYTKGRQELASRSVEELELRLDEYWVWYKTDVMIGHSERITVRSKMN